MKWQKLALKKLAVFSNSSIFNTTEVIKFSVDKRTFKSHKMAYHIFNKTFVFNVIKPFRKLYI